MSRWLVLPLRASIPLPASMSQAWVSLSVGMPYLSPNLMRHAWMSRNRSFYRWAAWGKKFLDTVLCQFTGVYMR